MLGFLWRMVCRFFFAVFFLIGGFFYAIPKWIIMGTRGGRERRKTNRLLREQNKLLRHRS